MPHLSVNQEAGQREKPGVEDAGQPGHRLRRAGLWPECDIKIEGVSTRRKLGVDGWVRQAQEFHPGDHCSCHV